MSRRLISAFAVLTVLVSTAAAAVLHDLTGKWNLAVVTDNGTGYPVLELKQEAERR